MISSADAWRWLVQGYGGITGMLVNLHEDPEAGSCPQEWLDKLDEYIRQIGKVVAEQKAKEPPQ